MWTKISYEPSWKDNFQLSCFWKLQAMKTGIFVNIFNGWECFSSFKYFSNLGGHKLGKAFPQDSNKENHSDKYRWQWEIHTNFEICINHSSTESPRKIFLRPQCLDSSSDIVGYQSIKIDALTMSIEVFQWPWLLLVFRSF